MKTKLFILSFFLCLMLMAQNTDQQLALEYYRNKEFDKASELFIKLYNSNRSTVYFNYYINCLAELERYDEAEKFIKKRIRKNPENPTFIVSLGYVYKKGGNEEKATEKYEQAIKDIKPNQSHILQLAGAFINKGEHSYAERTYLIGRKMLKGDYTFHFELANIYSYQRNYKKMIHEYLDLLTINESYQQSVQNRLWSVVYNNNDDSVRKILKSNLLQMVQRHPNKTIFAELLIWYYTQEKDYKNALTQAIALDKRNKEHGERLLAIGDLAKTGKEYDIALEAYRYVYDKGITNYNYILAKNRYLTVLYDKVFNTGTYTNQEVIELENAYIETLTELGYSDKTFILLLDLSFIQAFHLDKMDVSIERLRQGLLIPGLKRADRAKCKIMLADVLLLSGDPWEATLLYTQAEKENANNPRGYEAKYKKARLAYFQGNFRWAQAQLDVLKASTSKLIANDAFRLSQLIKTNTAVDSVIEPLIIFSRGDLLMYRNMDSLALQTYDSIPELYGFHSLNDEILFRKGNIQEKNQEYEKAIITYNKLIQEHPYDILGDDAMYRIASIYHFKLNNTEKAQEYYKELMVMYPGSIYVVDARKKFRVLRGDDIEEDSMEELFFQNIALP